MYGYRCSSQLPANVSRKLVPKILGNAVTSHGICHEQEAMAKYEAMTQIISPGLQVQNTGLVVSTTHPWLSASPDAVVTHLQSLDRTGLLEVKYPYSCRNTSLAEEAIKPSFFLSSNAGTRCLKEAHEYFYRVQFQLFADGHSRVDFFVWMPGEDSAGAFIITPNSLRSI